MKKLLLVAAALVCGAATSGSSVMADMAGRYSHHFQNGDMEGHSYWSDDVLEIVPLDARHAYFNTYLNFFNGHVCALNGVAELRGDTLLYRSPTVDPDDRRRCFLSIRRKGADLQFDDGDKSCKDYCGSRGSFGSATLPRKSKRAITYLAKIKASPEYRDALVEWRTGKPINP